MAGGRVRVLALGSAVVAALAFAAAAGAATVTWQGQTLGAPFGAIAVDGSGNLEVTASSCIAGDACFGAAHYNTSTGFRDAPGTAVVATFVDGGTATVGPQIWIEQERGPDAFFAEFGAFAGVSPDYGIYLLNEETGQEQQVSTGVARKAGTHTVAIAKRPDGTLDFYLDGALVHSTGSGQIDYLGDVYLAARAPLADPGQTVVFTAYSELTTYTGPPTSTGECKDGGWSSYTLPAFKNQGDCVSFVSAGNGADG